MAQSLVRAACLTQYAEVAQASGLNPLRMLLDVQLSLILLYTKRFWRWLHPCQNRLLSH